MSKLDIKPFSVGYISISAYDNEKGVLYKNIEIDSEKAVADLLECYSRALPFAVNIGYATEDTIKHILTKAAIQEKALSQKISNSSTEKKEDETK
jgi:hypothetical protein